MGRADEPMVKRAIATAASLAYLATRTVGTQLGVEVSMPISAPYKATDEGTAQPIVGALTSNQLKCVAW